MFKNAIIYHFGRGSLMPPLAALEEALQCMQFVACGPTQTKSCGFVPPRGEEHGALVESVGGQLIVRLCIETKTVPAAEVKRQLEARLGVIEQETGRRPKGKRAKEVKEEVIHELLPKAFPRRVHVTGWVHPHANRLVVDAGSQGKADELAGCMVEALVTAGGHDMQLSLLNTAIAPSTAMATWLVTQEPPPDFTLDRECVLQQPDTERASVRYSRHTLELDEIIEHIKQGKHPTALAMTYDGRVSFVLTETGALKKLKVLDAALEAADGDEKADAFDADVTIFTGEMHRMLNDLQLALGDIVFEGAAQ